MSTFVVNSSSRATASSSNSTTSMKMMTAPARDLTGSRLFQFYMESFFKIPKDIKNDIIYCQRALKAHIKVHQMVLDVFQQQPDADPQQKKRILDELESEIFEINAEQHLLLLRLRRIIDEFYKMLKKNGIPTDVNATNAIVSKEIVPHISDSSVEISPITVLFRSTEEKLIEKYFEVQKETEPEPQQPQCLEIIDLDDDGNVVEQITKAHSRQRGHKREFPSTSNSANGESLLKNINMGFNQTSLLKPMNQRLTNEIVPADVKPKITRNTTLADLYSQHMEEKEEKAAELPVSTNVRMSRMNLRQALKRAQAAARGPSTAPVLAPPPPPPPPPQPVAVPQSNPKASVAKTRATRASAASAASSSGSRTVKSPEITSSSEEGTPERGPTPPHAYWPDELEETRTKADEYGQEMFLKMFDLFTPEVHAQMQQRRSKRRRRCVQNNNYHYGSQASGNTGNEPEPKKKRKAFLLSPQVKKAIPNKRNKRRSADNASESNSVPPSRSASSSPDDKRSCNECFKGGYTMEQCEQCKFHYHPHCHREEDDPSAACEGPKPILSEKKICPGCKRNNDKLIKKEVITNKKLQNTAQELELKMAKEKDRREVLQRTGKQYKIQMNNIFKIVNSFITEGTDDSTTKTSSITISSSSSTSPNDNIILLD